MLVELVQIKQTNSGEYFLSPIFLNTTSIVYLSENKELRTKLHEGKLNLGLNQKFTCFTDVRLNHTQGYASTVTVVGDPGLIETKIFNKQQRQLLRG